MSMQKPSTPQLLVSVRSADELLSALLGGADWIDLKEPRDGPLAPVAREVALEVAAVLRGRETCPLSAALGELCDCDAGTLEDLLTVPGVSVVKIGLAGCANSDAWQAQWLAIHQQASSKGKQLAAVIYADHPQAQSPAPEEILAVASAAGCQFLLIDTFDKQAGSTFEHLPKTELEAILRAAKGAAMTTALAGSLTLESLQQVPRELVDIVAVRGAVCRGERTEWVAAELVEEFRRCLAVPYVAPV